MCRLSHGLLLTGVPEVSIICHMRKSTNKSQQEPTEPIVRPKPATKEMQADYTGKVVAEISDSGAFGYGAGGVKIVFTDGSKLVISIEQENYGHGDYGDCIGYTETPATDEQ